MSYQRRKVRVGRVVGDKMHKTCIVEVEWRSFHRRYKKSIRRRSRFKAHDENNTAQIGDKVTIIESRPMSRTKRWRLVDIVERQETAEMPPIETILIAEMEALMLEPVIQQTVSQEEESPAQMPALDESQDESVTTAEDEPAVADDDEGDAEAVDSEVSETPEEVMDMTPESADDEPTPADDAAEHEDAPADETSEPEDVVEEMLESADDEAAPAQDVVEAEDVVEETSESADDEVAPARDIVEAEDAMEETAESTDDEAAPAQEEEEPEGAPAAAVEDVADEDAPAGAGENEAMDEKADEENPRQ